MPTEAFAVRVDGLQALKKAMKAIGDTNAPFLTRAMEQAGPLVAAEVPKDAPRHLRGAVAFVGVRGIGGNVRALIEVSAPDANRQEFGRAPKPYLHSGTARGRRRTYKLKRAGYVYKGSKARPYVGVKNKDHALGRALPIVGPIIERAILAEWNDLRPDTP